MVIILRYCYCYFNKGGLFSTTGEHLQSCQWLNRQGYFRSIITHRDSYSCTYSPASLLTLPSSACVALSALRWETVGAVWRNWPGSRGSPEHSTERPLAGWVVAGKQVKQQTTTPALHNSSRDSKKSILKKGLTHVILFL